MLGYDAISINLLKIKSIVRLTQPTIKNVCWIISYEIKILMLGYDAI